MREKCEDYGSFFYNMDPDYQKLYSLFMKDSFPEGNGEKKKEMGISWLSDVPVVYSLKYKKGENEKRLRCVVEPGGPCVTVAEHIDAAIACMNEFFSYCEWQDSTELNQLFRIIFPKEEKDTRDWLSGMWLGMDSGIRPAVLKIYMNLRHQEEALRWRKLAGALGCFAQEDFRQTYQFMEETLYRKGSPVGISCAAGKTGVLGIRIYFAFSGFAEETVRQMYEAYYPEGYQQAKYIMTALKNKYREGPTNLTLEFMRGDNGYLQMRPFRLKSEFSLCFLSLQEQEGIREFVADALDGMGYDASAFREDLAFMETYLDSVYLQYLSVGAGREGEHVSFYLEPVEAES